jgi:hypothetical protein
MSNAIVVAKEDIIQETMKGLGIKTRMIPFRERDADPDAYKIGIESANKVALNNAVHARNHEFDGSLEDKEEEGDSEVLLLGHG